MNHTWPQAEHPTSEIRDCANEDGRIQICRCGGTACPGWCHVISRDPQAGAGHHCWPWDAQRQPGPKIST
jgi:hypothetical protein